jgi:N-carbamoyl-L-amino-acid hydrolase
MVVELRAADEARLARAQGELAAFAAEVATAHRLGLEQRAVRPGSAVPMDSGVQDEIEAASAALGLRTRRLVSWAGHDASSFAPLAPTGMIFVPSQGGVSHAPDERTAWADAEAGVRVLALTACRLDARLAARAAARGGKAGS